MATGTTFSRVFNAWLRAQDLTPTQAAPILGVSRSVSYAYAAGKSLPCGTKISHVAKILGVGERKLANTLKRDRTAAAAVAAAEVV